MPAKKDKDPALEQFFALSMPKRLLHAHRRLLACIALGVAIGLLLPSSPRLVTRLLVAWDGAAVLFLVLVVLLMVRTDAARIQRNALIQDEGRFFILSVTAVAAFASLGAIFFELDAAHRGAIELSIAIATITLSWCIIHASFALHYAHEYYRGGVPGGLVFPNDDRPDYWDFLYFSLVIGMTAQVSDVDVESKIIRRTVAVHGFISFTFNTLLLALMVNIAASAI